MFSLLIKTLKYLNPNYWAPDLVPDYRKRQLYYGLGFIPEQHLVRDYLSLNNNYFTKKRLNDYYYKTTDLKFLFDMSYPISGQFSIDNLGLTDKHSYGSGIEKYTKLSETGNSFKNYNSFKFDNSAFESQNTPHNNLMPFYLTNRSYKFMNIINKNFFDSNSSFSKILRSSLDSEVNLYPYTNIISMGSTSERSSEFVPTSPIEGSDYFIKTNNYIDKKINAQSKLLGNFNNVGSSRFVDDTSFIKALKIFKNYKGGGSVHNFFYKNYDFDYNQSIKKTLKSFDGSNYLPSLSKKRFRNYFEFFYNIKGRRFNKLSDILINTDKSVRYAKSNLETTESVGISGISFYSDIDVLDENLELSLDSNSVFFENNKWAPYWIPDNFYNLESNFLENSSELINYTNSLFNKHHPFYETKLNFETKHKDFYFQTNESMVNCTNSSIAGNLIVDSLFSNFWKFKESFYSNSRTQDNNFVFFWLMYLKLSSIFLNKYFDNPDLLFELLSKKLTIPETGGASSTLYNYKHTDINIAHEYSNMVSKTFGLSIHSTNTESTTHNTVTNLTPYSYVIGNYISSGSDLLTVSTLFLNDERLKSDEVVLEKKKSLPQLVNVKNYQLFGNNNPVFSEFCNEYSSFLSNSDLIFEIDSNVELSLSISNFNSKIYHIEPVLEISKFIKNSNIFEDYGLVFKNKKDIIYSQPAKLPITVSLKFLNIFSDILISPQPKTAKSPISFYTQETQFLGTSDKLDLSVIYFDFFFKIYKIKNFLYKFCIFFSYNTHLLIQRIEKLFVFKNLDKFFKIQNYEIENIGLRLSVCYSKYIGNSANTDTVAENSELLKALYKQNLSKNKKFQGYCANLAFLTEINKKKDTTEDTELGLIKNKNRFVFAPKEVLTKFLYFITKKYDEITNEDIFYKKPELNFFIDHNKVNKKNKIINYSFYYTSGIKVSVPTKLPYPVYDSTVSGYAPINFINIPAIPVMGVEELVSEPKTNFSGILDTSILNSFEKNIIFKRLSTTPTDNYCLSLILGGGVFESNNLLEKYNRMGGGFASEHRFSYHKNMHSLFNSIKISKKSNIVTDFGNISVDYNLSSDFIRGWFSPVGNLTDKNLKTNPFLKKNNTNLAWIHTPVKLSVSIFRNPTLGFNVFLDSLNYIKNQRPFEFDGGVSQPHKVSNYFINYGRSLSEIRGMFRVVDYGRFCVDFKNLSNYWFLDYGKPVSKKYTNVDVRSNRSLLVFSKFSVLDYIFFFIKKKIKNMAIVILLIYFLILCQLC